MLLRGRQQPRIRVEAQLSNPAAVLRPRRNINLRLSSGNDECNTSIYPAEADSRRTSLVSRMAVIADRHDAARTQECASDEDAH